MIAQAEYLTPYTPPLGCVWKNNRNPYELKRDGVYKVVTDDDEDYMETVAILTFKNGMLNGEAIFYDSKPKEKFNYKDNKIDGWGVIIEYSDESIKLLYQNGRLLRRLKKDITVNNLWKEVDVHTNKLIGYFNLNVRNEREGIGYCYKEGRIQFVNEYVNDKVVFCYKSMENGIMTEYDDNGAVIYSGRFLNNLLENFPRCTEQDLVKNDLYYSQVIDLSSKSLLNWSEGNRSYVSLDQTMKSYLHRFSGNFSPLQLNQSTPSLLGRQSGNYPRLTSEPPLNQSRASFMSRQSGNFPQVTPEPSLIQSTTLYASQLSGNFPQTTPDPLLNRSTTSQLNQTVGNYPIVTPDPLLGQSTTSQLGQSTTSQLNQSTTSQLNQSTTSPLNQSTTSPLNQSTTSPLNQSIGNYPKVSSQSLLDQSMTSQPPSPHEDSHIETDPQPTADSSPKSKKRKLSTKKLLIILIPILILLVIVSILIGIYVAKDIDVVVSSYNELQSIDWRAKTLVVQPNSMNERSISEFVIKGYSRLQSIVVNQNSLKYANIVHFEDLPKLEVITIQSNSFELINNSQGSFTIANCPSLVEMSLEANAFRYSTSFSLTGPSTLRSLSFGENAFVNINKLDISNLSKLEQLSFGNAAMTGNCEAGFSAQLKNLESLRTIKSLGNTFRCVKIVEFQNLPNVMDVTLPNAFLFVNQKLVDNAGYLEVLL